ncbi:lactate dehydrogenase-like 2-hydroxyacid dehydrogenase [Aminobacter lissarensis]|uniref:Lactate dehydrogenase-like 2-hydroxyacid dehydrogenase n=1 Tax=Aminobacter carboxidus TaxID=376165 RepID=A0A8E1WI26_9HYPH|nr:D-glycerate dehydrogenase [Aminobacter lissarensis]MBB6469395.1 lactate dehydrogenase-like 2-hydroxyacid dehydrogenase [Aminobacter lissarensis]
MSPRIIVTRRWPGAVEKVLSEQFGAVLNSSDRPMTQTEILAAFEDYDIVLPTVSDQLPAAIFPERPRARMIGNFGVGFSHIDVEAAGRHGIVVTNTPGVLTDCTADLAMALMLMIARRTGEGERQVRAGQWAGWCPTHMIGSRVSGKTLGIVGMGRIGRATARRARYGFGMNIVFHNRSRLDDEELHALEARQLDTVDDVLANADFVSLHCPGGADNRHLIDAGRIATMRPESFLINTARGDVVDEEALIDALECGRIAGAGLDVFANEPVVSERLKMRENVVLLPHLGSATEETRRAMGMKVVENLAAFLDGRQPPDRVA